ncbi:MAG: TPM domain-containing protein, partial [Cellulomonas sp.]
MNSGTGAPGLTAVLLVVVAVIAVTLAWTGLRAAARRRSPDREGARGVPPDEFAGETTAALNTRASASLVAIDDAITTSGQELGFAQAQFGAEATATFEVALTAARTSVARAFALRQQLDDAFPETEQQARAMASEIIRICSQVSADLDSHTHEFEALRDLQAHAPDLLDDVARQATEAGARVSAARVTLAGLSASYPATALASISANPDQVERLVAGITSTVTAGRAALATGDRAAAVAAARSGQAALAQAMSLLDAVGQAGANLAAAGRRLTSSIAVLNQDVIDAARLAPSDPEVVAQVAVATAAIAEAQRAAAGADPLEALRAVTRTQGELGARLAPYREQAEHAEAARKQLTDLLAHSTAQIGAVSD